MNEVTYTAYALTRDQAEAMGADAKGIMVQASFDDEGTQVFTGDDIYIDTDELTDTDDMDAALAAAGWDTISGWVESAGQWVAEVAR